MEKTFKIALIGLGSRGTSLLTGAILPAGKEYNVEVAAVYDAYEDRTEQGAKIVEDSGAPSPVRAKSYEEILQNDEIDGVIITSAWEAHIKLATEAMKAGKYTAVEVGGVYTVEDCWKLVDTYEETHVPCMMLENCCYGKKELMALNMVRLGVFGDIVHCSGGYHHDLRSEVANGKENRHYRLRNYINRNCENYPTHELGPIAKLLDINNGNRMVSLNSVSSCAKGLHEYVLSNKGEDSPLAKIDFLQGDVVTTVIKCAKGQTVVLTLDTTLPRTYSRSFTVRGTKGAYFEDTNMIFIDGTHNKYDWQANKIWDNAKEYEDKYLHPLWRNFDPTGGHDGMDIMVISAFFEAMRKGARPPIDVYDAASYMCITALSEESILKGGAPVAIPDFTRGKWYMRDDIEELRYNLDKTEPFEGIY